MSAHYRHTQVGWVTIASLFGPALVLVAIALSTEATALVVPLAVVLVAVGILFATLTVGVDERDLLLRFGPGLVRKRVPLGEVRSFRAVRNPWYYGWGIHFSSSGAVYNVSGLEAVELILTDGRRLRVGTDEPKALENALRHVLGEPATLTAEEQARVPRIGWKTLVLVVVGFTALLGGFLGGLLHVQAKPPVVTVEEDALVVDNLFYGERYPLGDVREMSLEERLPRVLLRTNGYAAGGTLRGKFRLETLGDGKLFLEARHPPFILVRTDTTFVIVGFEDPAHTRELYREMRRAWERRRM